MGIENKSTIKDDFNLFKGLRIKAFSSTEVLQLISSKYSKLSRLPKVIFFPGIEGDHGAFEPVAADLKAHVRALNYPLESPGETVQKVVETFLPVRHL